VVRGLSKFSQHFVGLEDCFILIGGTACELWMGSQGLDFRATKDLDIVLVVEAYYQYVIESSILIDEVPTIGAHCLIPLKARASLDLSARKQAGDITVNERHIKKHRNDVFRFYLTLAPADRYPLPGPLQTDLQQFLDQLPPESPD
jgi:hypothetical protein